MRIDREKFAYVAGAKGAGEAGICGAGAAVLNAINDALAPLGAEINETPATPDVILAAITRAREHAGP